MSIHDELAAHAELPFDQARMLPLAAYTSPEILAAETELLFGHDWLCIGRTADLPGTGDYITAELPTTTGTRSVIALRSENDEILVFDNVCIHRGAQLLAGCGNEQRITCPYHAWVYRLDGSLVGGPYMQDSSEYDGRPFDPSAHRLAEVRSEIWEGFVFVTLDAKAAPLTPRLTGLTDVVGRYDMAGYVPVRNEVDVWPTNWKLLVENFMDAYHIFKVHKDSFGADGDNTLDTTMHPGTLDWAHHRVLHEDGPDLAASAKNTLDSKWRKTIILAAVFPGFVIQLQPNWLWFLRITPSGTNQVRIAWQVAVAAETLAEVDDPDTYINDVNALIDQVNSEDLPVVAGICRNLNRPQFARAPLSYLERNVFDFDRYVATRLSEART